MRITLKDIAKKSGFSVTTVSRALAGYDDVSEITRERIMTIADEMGYQPNQIARQLQGQRTDTIGLIMPPRSHTTDDDFFSLLLKGITYAAAEHGYAVLVTTSKADMPELEVYQRLVGGNRIDGMIVARNYSHDPRIDYLQTMRHPFIVLGRSAPNQPTTFPYIDVDSQAGIDLLVTHFIERGCKHIGVILPPQELAYTGYRLAGYRAALERAGITLDTRYITYGDMTFDGGYRAAERLLDVHPKLDAIAGCNDWMALGAMAALRTHGYQPGIDIAIGGYDDIPAAEHTSPGLTTIRQPIYELGEQLTSRLVKIINQDPTADHQLLIQPQLIVRGSSGGP